MLPRFFWWYLFHTTKKFRITFFNFTHSLLAPSLTGVNGTVVPIGCWLVRYSITPFILESYCGWVYTRVCVQQNWDPKHRREGIKVGTPLTKKTPKAMS